MDWHHGHCELLFILWFAISNRPWKFCLSDMGCHPHVCQGEKWRGFMSLQDNFTRPLVILNWWTASETGLDSHSATKGEVQSWVRAGAYSGEGVLQDWNTPPPPPSLALFFFSYLSVRSIMYEDTPTLHVCMVNKQNFFFFLFWGRKNVSKSPQPPTPNERHLTFSDLAQHHVLPTNCKTHPLHTQKKSCVHYWVREYFSTQKKMI